MSELSILENMTGRNYLSFSSMSTYADCSERFYLERIASVPQEQGWWLPAGTALHTATEYLDHGTHVTAELAWADAWRETLARLDAEPTKAGGRASKAYPNKEDKTYWDAEGAGMVQGYLTWRDQATKDGWQLATINGAPAIEVPVEGTIGDVTVKGYIDRVFTDSHGNNIIVDLKSSKREPQSVQMDVYVALLQQQYNFTAEYVAYYMFRMQILTEPKPVKADAHTLGGIFSATKRGIEAEVFLPNVGMLCGTCGVRKYCSIFGTPPALDHLNILQGDTTHEEGQ